MLADGYIEYLDVEEEEGSFIATDLNHLYNQKLSYTHLEIHPAMILGVCASVIPFGNHNQGPRNTLQSAMGKQAMALNSTNFNIRLDTLFHILYYPQIPLASSKSLEFITAKDLPIGSNGVVGIACFTGYNQEDSILFNQSSIERGFMRSMFYRTYTEIETRVENDSSKERITEINLEKVSVTDASDFTKLDRDGIISPEQPVVGDAVLVGKVIEFAPDIEGNERKPKNVSLKARRTEFGHVDTVMISTNSKGHKIVKIRIRSKRVPQIGDKFASRHGQKGTVGMTFRQEDLPFNIEGIIPDIIINPHCIPSRMTIGHMIEQLSSKVASLTGVEGNATPFYGTSMHDISRELHENGYQKLGNEVLYNPFTGLRMDNQIFFGPTFYQRLRHLVDDKMYSRHRGPIQNLTRQPTHGRSVHGGLRFGEMERDCILSHGTSRFLKERTFEVSDMFRVHLQRM
ncbi:hypothetical protein PPERSA_06453 [Pseudocohnilembus persalinus]|uniref:DNA-directed RNA polymerase n=1 Tax=Pseudocohnilembus persalinus TaxID=266149 RepID=A0A0V0QRB3_PSEPJ|nr:hypothetical protein PPERSA_06453 [Pseudocohnilembus persalinus]|eukprot:KRX04819.1 hypothetical protein PPERSA_06453 [Pseudocohnilembus persalinus]